MKNVLVSSKIFLIFLEFFFKPIVTGKTIYAVVRTLGFQVEAYAVILECTGGGLYSAISSDEWGSYFYGDISSSNLLGISTPSIIATLSDDGENYEFRKDGSLVLSGSDGGGFYSRSASYLGNDSSAGQPQMFIYQKLLSMIMCLHQQI